MSMAVGRITNDVLSFDLLLKRKKLFYLLAFQVISKSYKFQKNIHF